jgi:hypothetical protein
MLSLAWVVGEDPRETPDNVNSNDSTEHFVKHLVGITVPSSRTGNGQRDGVGASRGVMVEDGITSHRVGDTDSGMSPPQSWSGPPLEPVVGVDATPPVD